MGDPKVVEQSQRSKLNELSSEDQELLQYLDLLENYELLENWEAIQNMQEDEE